VLLGLLSAFGATGEASIDPSQRARILAEGISEAMSGAAVGPSGS
jgi:biopolymer transport protein ExbB/TolQ